MQGHVLTWKYGPSKRLTLDTGGLYNEEYDD